jgi:arginine decarboxylase
MGTMAWCKHPDLKAVIVTSPTYEGIISPIRELADWCQIRNIRLIIDEAHGSLLSHTPGLPESACRYSGVDAVIQSLHKTAGALTQGAVLHLPHDGQLSASRVQQSLNHLQTTSPNYLVLASCELAMAWLGDDAGQAQRQTLWRNVKPLRERIKALSAFHLLESPDHGELDPLRIYLRHAYVDGETWAVQLEEQAGLSFELANPYGALYLCQPGHSSDDFIALLQGLQAYARKQSLYTQALPETFVAITKPALPTIQMTYTPREAFFSTCETLAINQTLTGRTSTETIVSCPPGVPVLVTGETVQAEHLPYLQNVRTTLNVVTTT